MWRPDDKVSGIRREPEKVYAWISKDGHIQLPVLLAAEQAALVVRTADGYRISLLRPDVKKVYLEVTTKCNFSCITCIRSSWQDELTHMSWETFKNIEFVAMKKIFARLPNLIRLAWELDARQVIVTTEARSSRGRPHGLAPLPEPDVPY
ncbi:hypothetical protein KIAC18_002110 [Sporomusa sphaeroides]|uniref:hypothetical protein n=1 Tax=Sporomusa sphaeroides TaxID=47679 RepID=UPI003DA05D31